MFASSLQSLELCSASTDLFWAMSLKGHPPIMGHCRDSPRKEDIHVKADLKIDGRLGCADRYFRFMGNVVINEGLVPSITMPLAQAQGHLSGTGGYRGTFAMKNHKGGCWPHPPPGFSQGCWELSITLATYPQLKAHDHGVGGFILVCTGKDSHHTKVERKSH